MPEADPDGLRENTAAPFNRHKMDLKVKVNNANEMIKWVLIETAEKLVIYMLEKIRQEIYAQIGVRVILCTVSFEYQKSAGKFYKFSEERIRFSEKL